VKFLGQTEKHFLKDEEISRANARRSLVAKKSIPAGKVIELDDIEVKRPGTGISPELYDSVIGSIATRNIEEDEILNFGDFKTK